MPGTTSKLGSASAIDCTVYAPDCPLPTTGSAASALGSVSPNTSRFFWTLCTVMSSAKGDPVQ